MWRKGIDMYKQNMYSLVTFSDENNGLHQIKFHKLIRGLRAPYEFGNNELIFKKCEN